MFTTWRETCADSRDKMAFMKKAGARIVMKGQSLAFDLWYTSAMDAKEKMALVKKAGARIIMRGISMAWLNWHDVCSSAKGERDKMLRIWCEDTESGAVEGMGWMATGIQRAEGADGVHGTSGWEDR